MDVKVAALIVNYNMPERADALAEHIMAHCPADVFLIDNGSDLCEPASHTNIWLSRNEQTTKGWLAGYRAVQGNYDAYWFLITSAEFIGGDPLTPMLRCLSLYSHCVGVHPALSADSTTSWEHMKTILPGGYRRAWMIDNIAALYRADWFDANPFDPELIFAWGIDLELGYKARLAKKSMYISEPAGIKKVTDIGYSMNRMGMTADERREKARANMNEVFTKKYGENWKELMYVQ